MARAWLEKTNPSEYTADTRQIAWTILTSWDREGLLARSGIDLGPELARALEREAYGGALLAMAGYVPRLAEVNTRPEAARAVVAHWEAHSRDGDWDFCLAAWVGRWNLMRAGVLTAEEQARFGADYVEAVKFELEVFEPEVTALLTLAQITPPGTFPLATWAGRLSDQDDRCRLAARLAIHGWLVDMASGSEASGEQRVASRELPLVTHHSPLAITRRQIRQAMRWAGQEGTDAGRVAPFVNLPPEVLPDSRRLHEIETALAVGQMPPPPPDAGAGNRAIPRTVLARLPEAHPRTGPPGITDRTTGRTAGSDPQARHPFPEVIRHE